MAEIPKFGRCVFCSQFVDGLTAEHVFPKSWYPDTTLPNLEKWQVPSCPSCNAAYGELENDLMIRIGLCLDPDDPNSYGVPQKAIRAIDPNEAKSDLDRKHREAKRKKILRQAFYGIDIPEQGIYPNFGNIWDLPLDDQVGIPIPQESLKQLSEKIVKGITFLESGDYIEPPLTVSFFAVHDQEALPVRQALERFGKVYAREPGIVVTRAKSNSPRIRALYAIDIWGRLKMYASVNVAQ